MAIGQVTTDRLTLRHVGLAGLMGALAVWVTLPAWQDIFLIAKTDEENSHIFLVPLVAMYLVWVRRFRLRRFAIGSLLFMIHSSCAAQKAGSACGRRLAYHVGASRAFPGEQRQCVP